MSAVTLHYRETLVLERLREDLEDLGPGLTKADIARIGDTMWPSSPIANLRAAGFVIEETSDDRFRLYSEPESTRTSGDGPGAGGNPPSPPAAIHAGQPSDVPVGSGHVGPHETIERDFRRFDDANPEVYRELVRLARLWCDRYGSKRLGVKTLYEVARWNLTLRTRGEPFKLNNNYTALYARKIARHEPALAGLFETRKLAPECRCSRCRAFSVAA